LMSVVVNPPIRLPIGTFSLIERGLKTRSVGGVFEGTAALISESIPPVNRAEIMLLLVLLERLAKLFQEVLSKKYRFKFPSTTPLGTSVSK